MKVMIDTTVFLAECLLPVQKYPRLMRKIVDGDRLVMSESQIEEIRGIVSEYFRDEGDTVELFLDRFSIEKVPAADKKSDVYPFLAEAAESGVSSIITLDEELLGEVYEGVSFVSPDEYLSGD